MIEPISLVLNSFRPIFWFTILGCCHFPPIFYFLRNPCKKIPVIEFSTVTQNQFIGPPFATLSVQGSASPRRDNIQARERGECHRFLCLICTKKDIGTENHCNLFQKQNSKKGENMNRGNLFCGSIHKKNPEQITHQILSTISR